MGHYTHPIGTDYWKCTKIKKKIQNLDGKMPFAYKTGI